MSWADQDPYGIITTTTTVLGLLPLVVVSGAGSELYRGLGSVVLGGLLVSTMLTLVLVPTVFTLTMDIRLKVVGWWQGVGVGTADSGSIGDGERGRVTDQESGRVGEVVSGQ